MTAAVRQQILISGVGGQGVLFVTRLLAEAAILRGLPVFTSETHGMAQRGGTVVSHLKIGDFHSPLIRAGQADGLLVLKAENVAQHALFLKPGGWITVNAGEEAAFDVPGKISRIDADRLSQEVGQPKSLNLVVLGFALAVAEKMKKNSDRLFCSRADIEAAVASGSENKPQQAAAFLKAIRSGYDAFVYNITV